MAGALLFIVLVLLVGYLQPTLPGRWCDDNEVWQLCFRNWLSSLGGYVALLVGALSIVAIRKQIDASENIARSVSKEAQLKRIAKYNAALEVSMLTADGLKTQGADASAIFEKYPALLLAESEPRLKSVSSEIKTFNTKIGDYISLTANTTNVQVNAAGTTKLAGLRKELYGLKNSIQSEVRKLFAS